jgi:hypothetical protein
MTGKTIRVVRRIVAITAITIATLVALLLLAIFVLDQSYRLHTRTVAVRQFHTDGEWWETNLRTIREFEARHDLDPEARDGLRLAIGEWPAWKYLISIDLRLDKSARGAIQAIPYEGEGPTYERDFSLDEYEAHVFFGAYDRRIEGYWGSATMCTDGTGFQFERWSGKKVSSGSGNAACHRHYAELMSLLAETLITKVDDQPFDWRSWFVSKRYLELKGRD